MGDLHWKRLTQNLNISNYLRQNSNVLPEQPEPVNNVCACAADPIRLRLATAAMVRAILRKVVTPEVIEFSEPLGSLSSRFDASRTALRATL